MHFLNRKRNRLRGHDYSLPGYYYVTICVKYRRCYLGNVVNEKMVLNRYGEIVDTCWNDLSNHYQNCVLDEYVIMPNHVHGIILIINSNDGVGTGFKPVPTKTEYHSLSEIIRGFKTFSSRRINELHDFSRFQWQRSFHDHIIRNKKSLQQIRRYVQENPLKWAEKN